MPVTRTKLCKSFAYHWPIKFLIGVCHYEMHFCASLLVLNPCDVIYSEGGGALKIPRLVTGKISRFFKPYSHMRFLNSADTKLTVYQAVKSGGFLAYQKDK